MLRIRNFFFFLFFLFALGLFFPKQAKAQSCVGSLNCWSCSLNYKCSISGIDCSVNQCPLGETCQSSCTWVPNGTQNCTGPGDSLCTRITISCPDQNGTPQSKFCSISGTPTPTPGPTSPPGWQACNSCNCGHGAGGTGECQLDPNGVCQWNPCFCAGVGCGGGGSDPCPNDSCAGSCCNYTCVTQPCIVTADCAPSSSGQPVICAWGTNPNGLYCRNANCPNNTVPGSICACSGGLVCGQACAGGCTGNSTCRYTTAPGGSCVGGASTYCIGDTGNGTNTYNPSYITPQCASGDTGNKYLYNTATGQSSGFTQAQIDSTCKPGPWFQVKDGDVITNGRIQSLIPLACSLPTCTPYFDLNGTGTFPGVVVYGSSVAPNFAVSGGAGTVSSKKWLANTSYMGKTYNYSYFEGLIPGDVLVNDIPTDTISGSYLNANGTPSHGFVWFRRNGNLTITGNVNVNSTRKYIILVKGGNLTVSSNIRVSKVGDGFFLTVVNGNIFFDPTLTSTLGTPAVEGLFLADGTIHTGAGTSQLYVRGSMAALGGFFLERDLGNSNGGTPAEVVEYAPDFLFSYPRDLAKSRVIWREIAP